MAVNNKSATKAKSKKTASIGPAKRAAGATSRAGLAAGVASDHPKPWTFLTNHAHVLILLHGQPDLVLREVAGRVGITERAVQRIVHELEEEGFIRRHRVGRRNEYEVLPKQTLRHPIESHRKIGDLLQLMAAP